MSRFLWFTVYNEMTELFMADARPVLVIFLGSEIIAITWTKDD